MGNSVSFPDHNLASMACAIPIAIGDWQRFILHYLSATKHTPSLCSTVVDHAQTTEQKPTNMFAEEWQWPPAPDMQYTKQTIQDTQSKSSSYMQAEAAAGISMG